MAVLERNLICSECGKTFNGIRTRNRIDTLCNECLAIEEEKEKQEWLKEWRDTVKFPFANSLEARVAKIEEWIYEQEMHRPSDRIPLRDMVFGQRDG